MTYFVNILMYINHHLTTFRGHEKEVKATLHLREDYLHGRDSQRSLFVGSLVTSLLQLQGAEGHLFEAVFTLKEFATTRE